MYAEKEKWSLSPISHDTFSWPASGPVLILFLHNPKVAHHHELILDVCKHDGNLTRRDQEGLHR